MTIVSVLIVINLMLSIGGLAGWCWVWFYKKYRTGVTARVQWGMIAFGVMWVSLIMADTTGFVPVIATVIARALIVFGCWCCMPLLEHKGYSE